jgi:hypothetical protein
MRIRYVLSSGLLLCSCGADPEVKQEYQHVPVTAHANECPDLCVQVVEKLIEHDRLKRRKWQVLDAAALCEEIKQ